MVKIVLAALMWAGCAAAFGGEIERDVLFRGGEGGYVSYRIPAVIATSKGTLLAFCEGRKNGGGDTGEINLLMKRSEDGGKTFGETRVVWADGPNTCGNPCPVVDAETGVVWLLLTHNLGADNEKTIKALSASGTRTVWVTSSGDEGKTWEPVREITSEVKKAEWAWYATGPGIGIQLTQGAHKGRMVVPCDYVNKKGGEDPKGGNAHVIYSDDHGKSWRIGGEPAERLFNESQVVELEGGKVMLNMRNGRIGKPPVPIGRGVAVSEDGGETFGPWRRDEALPEPICQGSILRYSWGSGGKILFANPASGKREKMTVRVSGDEGKTWDGGKVIWEGPAAYSSLVKLSDGRVGLLYECGEKKAYERIEWARFSVE